jgi:hypothetical protein
LFGIHHQQGRGGKGIGLGSGAVAAMKYRFFDENRELR